MATIELNQYNERPSKFSMGESTIGSQWNTVLDEYQNSQDWFKDLIYIHLDNSVKTIKEVDRQTQMVNPAFEQSDKLKQEYSGLFRPFDESEWDNIDELSSLTENQLDQDLRLLKSQREDTLELETEILGDEKDAKIEEAELNLDKQLNSIDSDKVQLKNKALSSLSQIEDLVADTGILSGSFKQKKKIAENAITTSLNQANYNRILAVKKSQDAKITAERNFDRSIAKSELKFDTQYETKFQSAEQKKETMDLNIMLDKMDIYQTWKADQIGNLAQITYSDYYMNKPDPIDPKAPYVNEVPNEAFQNCMQSGGTIDSCQEFMELVTDVQDVIPDPYTPTDQDDLLIGLQNEWCKNFPWWPGC
tara:strand:- start:13 stop:1101 length:1089 start_codon:yes stop_codon:yes gene_type:complete